MTEREREPCRFQVFLINSSSSSPSPPLSWARVLLSFFLSRPPSLPFLFFLLVGDAMYPSQLFRAAALEQPAAPAGFHIGEAVLDVSQSSMLSPTTSITRAPTAADTSHVHFASMNSTGLTSLDMVASAAAVAAAEMEMGRFSFPRSHLESWGDSGMVAVSPIRTESSTDLLPYERNHQMLVGDRCGSIAAVDCSDTTLKEAKEDQKVLRRLAQNREAARKSRLRKKAYVQQLESCRSKLKHLERELQQAHQQGIVVAGGRTREYDRSSVGNRATTFDTEYARWLDDHQEQIGDLRLALCSQVGDDELRLLVDVVMAHYDEVFKLKSMGTRSDVFHMLSGMWMTPAERCFMWLGGFRCSELLKILSSHLEPLTDQQLMGICNLQQSSLQAEDALSQGMEALQQSLSESISCASLFSAAGSDNNVAAYVNQMATAMGKLSTLENFLWQADLLMIQTLQQMRRILTTRQAARALLAIHNYFSRLRALSAMWLARPRD